MSLVVDEYGFAFHRVDRRRTRLKRRLDCGHVIDGSEPYRYVVFKLNGADRIVQQLDCEFCARRDDSY
jgi:hypothetical protein